MNFQCFTSKTVIVTLLSTIIVFLSYLVQLSDAQNHTFDVKKVTQAITSENTELDEWEAPKEFTKSYPYYFGGYDFDDRPVWFSETGKWDLRKLFSGSPATIDENVRLFEKYTNQYFYRFHNSPKLWPKENPENSTVDEWGFIVDLDGYNLRQLGSAEANYVGHTLINLIKPVLGNVFNNFEVYGSNKKKWIPQLLRRIPKDNLPTWYGGSSNYTPIAVYG